MLQFHILDSYSSISHVLYVLSQFIHKLKLEHGSVTLKIAWYFEGSWSTDYFIASNLFHMMVFTGLLILLYYSVFYY